MSVKVRSKQLIMGKQISVASYLPEGQALTKDRRQKAELLDVAIKKLCDNINEEYAELPSAIRQNDYAKWKWLGEMLNQGIKKLKNHDVLEQSDIDNNAIWPGFAQFMRPELNRGMNTRRSGSKKDHYRKCWLLATTPNTQWIRTWTGWDAFVDRGEQLIASRKIMPILEKELAGIKLGKSDYQELARNIVDELPSYGRAASIAEMNAEDLKALIHDVCSRLQLSNRPSIRE